jgi:hypothetical protein
MTGSFMSPSCSWQKVAIAGLLHDTGTPPVSALKRAQAPPLELNQPTDVVAEVHHPDLEPRPRDADGAHDLAAHRALLLAEIPGLIPARGVKCINSVGPGYRT